jgi:hypothetical protein
LGSVKREREEKIYGNNEVEHITHYALEEKLDPLEEIEQKQTLEFEVRLRKKSTSGCYG